ncbi:hypothetical protein ACFXGA_21025 [Actinosynnema sp. NPDC059335]|uniref:hypothetical protein n=1 Tax=Actinosynnema sp. NPDC059335 TaxID=3346804 RepID=UPI00366DD9B0
MGLPRKRVPGELVAGLTGRYRAHGDPREVSCVIACSFGYRRSPVGTEPGVVNDYLARSAIGLFPGKPVLAQVEVAECINRLPGGPERCIPVGQVPDDADRYVSTSRVLRQCRGIMAERGWSTAAIVAHPYHLPRVDVTAGRLGIDTVAPAGLAPLWDRASAQVWTRSPGLWQVRELFVGLALIFS